MSADVPSLAMLHAALAACRRCAEAGYRIGSRPIFILNPGATFMTIGQAPGRRPFRWLRLRLRRGSATRIEHHALADDLAQEEVVRRFCGQFAVRRVN